MTNALGRHMSNVSETKEVHEFIGTFASLRLCAITVERETDDLEAWSRQFCYGVYAMCRLTLWFWLNRSRLGVLDIIQFRAGCNCTETEFMYWAISC